MLDFFRHVAQTIPVSPPSPSANDSQQGPNEAVPIEPMQGSARDMLQDRAGIIVLQENLDFYAIPPNREIEQTEMMEVKRAAGRALLKQDGIFSGLRKSEEPGSTEQHLIEMLTAGFVQYIPWPVTTALFDCALLVFFSRFFFPHPLLIPALFHTWGFEPPQVKSMTC